MASHAVGMLANDRGDHEVIAKLRTENAQLRSRVAELETLADSDTLTPLPNRRLFMRELERAARKAERYGSSAAVFFVDVDALKEINDRHGHHAGDMALVHVAALLRDNVRSSDVVARIGGDEFGLLIEHVDEATALEKAERLRIVAAATPLPNGIVARVSIGVAMLSPDHDHLAALATADGAMYIDKRARC